MRNEQYKSICDTSDDCILLIFHVILGSPDDHFWSFWRSLGTIWVPFCNQVGHGCTHMDPGRSQDGFLMIFGSPFGDNFGSLFDILGHLKRHKSCLDCRHDF